MRLAAMDVYDSVSICAANKTTTWSDTNFTKKWAKRAQGTGMGGFLLWYTLGQAGALAHDCVVVRFFMSKRPEMSYELGTIALKLLFLINTNWPRSMGCQSNILFLFLWKSIILFYSSLIDSIIFHISMFCFAYIFLLQSTIIGSELNIIERLPSCSKI